MSYWRLFYHIVWGTKSREHSIDGGIEAFLLQALPGITRTSDGLCHATGIMPDHVHMVLSIPPRVAVAVMVKQIKGSSSHMINHELRAPWTGWQPGYGALTFSERNLPEVVEYVRNQKQRHSNNNLYKGLERFDAESSS